MTARPTGREASTSARRDATATDTPPPKTPEPVGAVIPIDRARRIRTPETTNDHLRHDNPHWPVRSPTDAANALLLHGGCPWHCSTRVAALLVSRNDFQYFRNCGHRK
ncbi:hypothetical protein IU449_10295 [Nocardia higoensis]|uniref:Uncharacterized protein n=1 Tax=Nocardia higoensis TaxID=228599 RepID=A0ABS0DDE6_9NOCA|nr:hypothetical protein [Nocardia higoensis]MBF6354929.1 hypothetical protein [Nocardia higoensis]